LNASDMITKLQEWPAPYRGEVPVVVEKLLDRYAYQVVVQGKNLIFAFLGDVGSGKSWGAVNFARLFDPWFDIDRKVVYEPDEFFDALDSVRHRGEVIVWDEAGVGMNAREWNSIFNKVVSKTLQIFREATPGRIILIFATPRKAFMDKTARIMLNAEWRFSWNLGEIHPYAIPYELHRVIHYKTKTLEDYTVYRLPVVDVGNLRIKVKRLYMATLPKEIAERYVMRSQPRKHELRFIYAIIQALGEDFPSDLGKWLYNIVEDYGPEAFLSQLEGASEMKLDVFSVFVDTLKDAIRRVGSGEDRLYFEELMKYFEGDIVKRNRFIRYFIRWLRRRTLVGGGGGG